jgi:hypothetical protein
MSDLTAQKASLADRSDTIGRIENGEFKFMPKYISIF